MQTQSNLKKVFWSRWFLLIGFFLSLFVAFAFARAYFKDYELRREIAQMEDNIKNLESVKLETLEMLQYVKTDNFVEEKARVDLNFIKPGEQSAIISRTKQVNGHGNKNVLQFNNLSNPAKWWRLFFHRSER